MYPLLRVLEEAKRALTKERKNAEKQTDRKMEKKSKKRRSYEIKSESFKTGLISPG